MSEFLFGLLILCLYFIICATLGITCRKLLKIPDELFRKILHFVLLGSLFVFIYVYSSWWISVLTCLLIILIAYPILYLFERFKSFSSVMSERKKGEIRNSLILVFLMFAIVISICWGLLTDKILVLVVIFSWGFGDAFAALIGTKYGKHKLYKKKSLEGTIAMFLTSLITISTILLLHNIIPWYGSLISALFVSITVSVIELYTPNGFDTITCPLSSMITLIPIIILFGGLI